MEIMVVAGVSGSGKTAVVQYLSEYRYTILEGLKACSIKTILEEISSKDPQAKVALSLNFSDNVNFQEYIDILDELKDTYTIFRLYLSANTDTLVNRYKELRKVHPLQRTDKKLSLEDAILNEKNGLIKFKENSNFSINTSDTSIVDLRHIIATVLDNDNEFLINITSFGFKYGAVREADFVFDVRFLPNPYYIKELRAMTGLNKEVYDYVFSFDEANNFYDTLLNLINQAIVGLKKEKRITTNIAFACTGGKHRSVSFAQRLAKDLGKENNVLVKHIENQRGNW